MGFASKSALWLVFLGMAIFQAYAQEKVFVPQEGEVVEGEFVISKELEITLPAAQRIFQKVPPDEIDSRQTDELQYSFKSYTPQITDIRTRLRVLKLKDETLLSSGPASYITLGVGNYITPYLDAALNSTPGKTSNYGLKVHHLSSRNGPVDKSNSGDGHSSISLFGKYIGGGASIGGDLGYVMDKYHFYGYDAGADVSRDSIRQVFNEVNLGVNIQSNALESPLQYDIFGKLHNIADRYDASELAFKAGLDANYLLDDNMSAHLGLDMLFASYKNPDKINRAFVRINPSFVFETFGITLDVGVNIVNHNDSLHVNNNTIIYPTAKATYALTDNISAYGVLEGDVEEVTYKNLVNENPYLQANIPLTHTNKNVDIRAGVKGSLVQYIAFDAGVRSALYKNMYFYLNDPLAANRFQLLYDDGTTSLFQFYTSLSFFKNNLVGSTLSARFNAYSTKKVSKAWHRPKVELDYSIWYNFYNKVKLTGDIFILSGIQAFDLESAEPAVIKLDPSIDLNLKIDYILSEKYSVFVSASNLLNNNYQVYYRYPSRGLLAMIGLSASF
ncbi:MAG: hypothetical protein HC819_17310 [Cyclobacteriaceae bacterium]|nr:hypothetical protein [Cyclobacteriaceae bacterium]